MDLFDLQARITLDSSEYESGLSNASSKTESFGSKIKSGFGTLASVGTAALTAGAAAVTAFGVSSVQTGAQFDSSMAQVAATMGTTVDSITNLRDFALEMGSATAFSATEAANALNYMALAGYDADTSMSMLPNVLNLAAAGSIDLASASDMVTDAQSALGLTLDETSAMVDQMAMASSKSNTSVSQLGEAFLTIGATARNVAGGTQELSTVLGVLADNGIKGAEGGTHLRNMILSLQNPTNEGAAALEALGVSVYDADGNMRSLIDIIGDMQTGLDGMDSASRDAMLNGIFNKTDLAAANALLGTSSERFDELTAAIGDATGAAETMANTQLDNLAGDVTLFQSALEGAKIAVSDRLTPAIRDFVQFGTDGVSKLTAAFQDGGLSGAMSALGGIISDGITMIVEMLPQAVDAGGQLIGALVTGLVDNLPQITTAAVEIIVNLIQGLTENLPQIVQTASDVVTSIGGALMDAAPQLLSAGWDLISTIIDGILTGIPQLAAAIPNVISTITGALTTGIPKVLQAGIALLKAVLQAIPPTISALAKALPEVITTMVTFLTDNIPVILDAAIEMLNAIVDAIPEIIDSLVAALPDIIDAIMSGLIEATPLILDAAITLLMAIIEAIPQIIVALVEALPDIYNTIVEKLDEWGPQLWDMAVELFMQLVNAIPEILGALGEGLASIGTAITDAWEEIKSASGERLQGMWDNVTETFEGIKTTVTEKLTAAKDKAVEIFNAIKAGISEKLEAAKTAVSEKFEAIKNIMGTVMEAARSTVQEKLSNIQSAYQEHGGGVQGIVSAFMEVIKGYYTAGFTFIDELTGGKLSSILSTVTDKMSAVQDAVGDKLDAVKGFFTDKLGAAYTTVTGIFDNIKTAITDKLTAARDAVGNLIDSMRAKFNFSWSLPHLKLPHISISGGFSINPPSAPSFSIAWYRKAMDNAMILTNPTIFGAMNGQLLGGGEAGAEVVAGADTLMGMIQSATAGANEEILSLLRRILEALRNSSKTINMDIEGRRFAEITFQPLADYGSANGTPILNVG